MKRPLLVVLALASAVPAAAQEADPAWVGVWEGRVGTLPVRVCLDSWGEDIPGRGSYYYRSRLEPLSLSDAGDGMWIERASGSDAEAEWFIEQITDEAMRGLWRQGGRELRFELEPVAWHEGEWGGACASPEFMQPRLRAPELAAQSATLEGWRYSRRTYRPPAHFRDEVAIESFTFAPERPGDRAIIAYLDGQLPKGAADDAFAECIAGAVSAVGTDGYFERTVVPAMAAREFLAVDEISSNYCGGAHPNHYTVPRTFDRRDGHEVDLFDWIGAPRGEDGESAIPERLRELVVARWPTDSAADCGELAAGSDYWYLGLAREGLVFTPDMPHVATPCEEAVTVEWTALKPFLDAEGRAGLARLRGG